jgi:hypothetical protein
MYSFGTEFHLIVRAHFLLHLRANVTNRQGVKNESEAIALLN